MKAVKNVTSGSFKLLAGLVGFILMGLALTSVTNKPEILYGAVVGFVGAVLLDKGCSRVLRFIIGSTPNYSELDVDAECPFEIIEQHGMTAHLYLPTAGNHGDTKLSEALEYLLTHGFIVTQADGSLVGKVSTSDISNYRLSSRLSTANRTRT